jgi:hypothetical protein
MNKDSITLDDILVAKKMIKEREGKKHGVSYDYGLDFVITPKEDGIEVELPKIPKLIRSLEKLEDVFNEIMLVANKKSNESLIEQKRSIIMRIEWLQEAIEEAYSLPSKTELCKMVNECIGHMESIQRDADCYEKRANRYYQKYQNEMKRQNPDYDEFEDDDELDADWD